jgi:hypothetical protein
MFQLPLAILLIQCGLGNNVVTNWSFNSIEKGIVTESENNVNLVVSGATIAQGALHGGLYFDGVDDYAASNSTSMIQGTIGGLSQGTISAWFRFDHHPEQMDIETIFYFGAENTYSSFGTSANCYELEVGHFNSNKRLYWTNISTLEEDSSVPLCWATSNHLEIGRWYHIVTATSDSGTRVYLNDVEIYDSQGLTWQFGNESVRRFLGDVLQQEVLWFGKGLWNYEHKYFKGVIDEVKIWDYAITPGEVHKEHERVASVGELLIDNAIPQELVITASEFELYGSYDNIVKLQWQIAGGDWTTQLNNNLNSTWNLFINEPVPAGRHEVKVMGRNAASRPFLDSRILIQPDMTGDDIVDIKDLLIIIQNWGVCDCVEDLTGNGEVDFADVLIVIGAWSS